MVEERGTAPRRAFLIVVAVAYGWTWTGVLGAWALGGSAGHPLHLVGLLGPAVAVGLVGWRHGAYGRRLVRRTVDVRVVPRRWWTGAAAVGVLPPLLARGVSAAAGHDVETAALPLVLVALPFALAAGLIEEPAWRGVAQDAWERVAWAPAAVVVGVAWSLWHLPLHLLPGTYQHALGWGTTNFWLAMATRVPLAVLLVALVRGSRGAVVTAVVAHAVGNLAGEALPATTAVRAVELLVLLAAAAVVIVVTRDREALSGARRRTEVARRAPR